MKPLGRKYTKHNCKWKVKESGKNITSWWEDTIAPNKTADLRLVEEEIKIGTDLYESEAQERYLDSIGDGDSPTNWNCSLKGTDLLSHNDGECISCDWEKQMRASTGWADPNFIEAWDYDEYWLNKYRG